MNNTWPALKYCLVTKKKEKNGSYSFNQKLHSINDRESSVQLWQSMGSWRKKKTWQVTCRTGPRGCLGQTKQPRSWGDGRPDRNSAATQSTHFLRSSTLPKYMTVGKQDVLVLLPGAQPAQAGLRGASGPHRRSNVHINTSGKRCKYQRDIHFRSVSKVTFRFPKILF